MRIYGPAPAPGRLLFGNHEYDPLPAFANGVVS